MDDAKKKKEVDDRDEQVADTADEAKDADAADGFTPDEEAEIQKRLEDLGYI